MPKYDENFLEYTINFFAAHQKSIKDIAYITVPAKDMSKNSNYPRCQFPLEEFIKYIDRPTCEIDRCLDFFNIEVVFKDLSYFSISINPRPTEEQKDLDESGYSWIDNKPYGCPKETCHIGSYQTEDGFSISSFIMDSKPKQPDVFKPTILHYDSFTDLVEHMDEDDLNDADVSFEYPTTYDVETPAVVMGGWRFKKSTIDRFLELSSVPVDYIIYHKKDYDEHWLLFHTKNENESNIIHYICKHLAFYDDLDEFTD